MSRGLRTKCVETVASVARKPGIIRQRPDQTRSPAFRESTQAQASHNLSNIAIMPPTSARVSPVQQKSADVPFEQDSERAQQAATMLPTGGGGNALPPPVQAQMENSFGVDFSDVRIHEGAAAASIGAVAYTQGNNIHFQPGRYQPGSAQGQALLGHELTHVVQQRAGRVAVPQGKGAPINADPALEDEADSMGARAAQGETATVSGSASQLQRKAEQPIQMWNPFRGKKKEETLDDVVEHTQTPQAFTTLGAEAAKFQSLSKSESVGGGFGLLSPLAALGAGKNVYSGAKDVGGGLSPFFKKDASGKRGNVDKQRAGEGLATVGHGLTQGASAAASFGDAISKVGSLTGTAATGVGAVAPGLSLAVGSMDTLKGGYQFGQAERQRRKLEKLKTAHAGSDLEEAAAYAAETQRKRRNRAAINTTSGALTMAGGATAVATGATGVGAVVGASLAAGGAAVKYGALGLRKGKQAMRDRRAKREEDLRNRQAVDPNAKMSRTGRFVDWAFNPNVDKTTTKKQQKLEDMAQKIMNDPGAGEILAGLGANKKELAAHQAGTLDLETIKGYLAKRQ
jgi:hypothetical protein